MVTNVFGFLFLLMNVYGVVWFGEYSYLLGAKKKEWSGVAFSAGAAVVLGVIGVFNLNFWMTVWGL